MKWLIKNSALLLLVLGALALASGFVGYWGAIENPRPPGEHVPMLIDAINALLASIRHLALDGFDAPNGKAMGWLDYSITASRILAVLFVLVGAVQLLSEITHDFGRLRFWWRNRYGRELDLIVGLGWHGCELVSHMHPSMHGSVASGGKNTIVIDMAPSEHAIDLCTESGIVWWKADINTSATLEALCLKNIRRVYLVTGSDETHAQVLRKFSELKPTRRLECRVSVKNAPLFEALLDEEVYNSLDIRTFNDFDTTAQMLLLRQDEVHAFPADVEISRFILLGDGQMFDALLLQWLQQQILEIPVEIDVVHPAGRQAAESFVQRYPCYRIDTDMSTSSVDDIFVHTSVIPRQAHWLQEKVLPQIRFHRMPVAAGQQMEWIEKHLDRPGCRTVVAVVSDSLSKAVSLAQSVIPALQDRNQTLFASSGGQRVFGWVYLNTQNESLFKQLDLTLKKSFSSLFSFRDYLGECSKRNVSNDVIERAAMKVHAHYTGVSIEDPEALWFGSPKHHGPGQGMPPASLWSRESSRLCGAHAWVKRGIGQRLLSGDPSAAASEKQVEELFVNELSAIEHRRWCAVHLLRGWRPLLVLQVHEWQPEEIETVKDWYQRKDKYRSRLKHLCLVPYAHLAHLDQILPGKGTKEQGKDFIIVRANMEIIVFAENQAIGSA